MERLCLNCQKDISNTHFNRKFCSLSCKQEFYSITKGYNRLTQLRKCLVCGKEFHPSHKTNKFCSRECGVRGRRGKTAPNKIEFKCYQCGKLYYRKRYLLGKTKFCSKKCQSIFQVASNRGKKNPNWKGGISYNKGTLSGNNKAYKKGRYYENKTRKIYESRGYYVIRSGASKGPADLVAFNSEEIIIIQVKAGKSFFGPEERNKFIAVVIPKNGRKELWAWRGRKAPVIIDYTNFKQN